MESFTPGPWRVDETVALGAYGVWTDYGTHLGDGGHTFPSQVCSVFPRNESDFPREQRDANARLIAAAPELLAVVGESQQAVQAFLDMVSVMQRVQAVPIPSILETAAHNCPIIIARIEAAIAKATDNPVTA
jgi:hypothetical protein